jgi:energy-coupling factor transport system permease protein
MEDLELLRNITIGQYLPTGSFVHRLDPRAKVIGLGLLILGVALLPSLAAEMVALLVILGLVALARVRIGYALGGLRPALPFLLILALLQLLFGWSALANQSCETLWSLWLIHITNCSVVSVLSMLVRLTAMILLTSLLTLTSTISELTLGIESLLRPFQQIGLPAHELAMVFTLALRFVPTLAEELEKLLKAQAARGADIRLGANPIQRARHFLPILVPLFLTTLHRVDELTEAMTARGYSGGKGRSRYTSLHWSSTDGIALLCALLFMAILIFAPFQSIDVWFRGLLHLIISAHG